jgi:hypothetical protein
MSDSDPVTRGEFEMLKQVVSDNQARLLSIDEHGTRGVGIVQVQLNEVIKDLAELKTSFESEKQMRKQSGRWRIDTVIAFMAMIAAIVLTAADLLTRSHG